MTKLDDIYQRALTLSNQFDGHFLELGKALRTLWETDHDLFQLCVQNSGISRRTVYYLIEVDQAFEMLHVPKERLVAIGWTKLHVISSHVSKQNVGIMLKLAESETTRNLKSLMKGEQANTRPHCVQLYFTEEQYAQFVDAVLPHGAQKSPSGLIGKEEAIVSVIGAYKKLLAHFAQHPGTGHGADA